MAIGEQPKDISKSKALIPAEPPGISPADVREPTPPQGLSEEELQQLKERALALVDQLVESSGSREMELADSITSLGIQSQRRAGTELDLLKGRMGEILSGDGPGAQISRELVDLRVTLDQINPHQAGKTWSTGHALKNIFGALAS